MYSRAGLGTNLAILGATYAVADRRSVRLVKYFAETKREMLRAPLKRGGCVLDFVESQSFRSKIRMNDHLTKIRTNKRRAKITEDGRQRAGPRLWSPGQRAAAKCI